MLSVDICKKAGDFHLQVAFEAKEEVMGILGASGCGKSMTLRCIAGVETPDSGRIVLNGVTLYDSEKKINLPPQRRHVGYLFQNYALFPNMTVKRNILCGLRNNKDKQHKIKAYKDVIELLKLQGLENHRPSQLSGGQAQRVALARILVNKPHILMLDEPFSALDSNLRELLQIQMKELMSSYDGAVLMVTHSRNEAYNLCKSIALMDNGRFLSFKPTKELFAQPDTIAGAVMTGCKNIAAAAKCGEYELEVREWGIRLVTSEPVRDDVCAVGIRAHYFSTKTKQNRCAVRKMDEIEEPFEMIILFRYQSQQDETADIWWRLPKDRNPQQMPSELGIAAHNVLPLYPS